MRFTIDRIIPNATDVDPTATLYQSAPEKDREDFGPTNQFAVNIGSLKAVCDRSATAIAIGHQS